MAKLIKNTANVFDGFGFGGVSVPERETFYDKSMNRLNSLVERDSTLQRLRDISCQLMLGDRQQEELVNYVNGFINNFQFCEGQRWRRNSIPMQPPVWANWEWMETFSPNVSPVIKDVFPCQGTFSSLETLTEGGYYKARNYFSIRQFVERFTDSKVPQKAYWIGFVSEVSAMGQISFNQVADGMIFDYSEYLKPYTIAYGDQTLGARFTKLTDTSPLVSKDGNVYVDFLESRVWQSLLSQMIATPLKNIMEVPENSRSELMLSSDFSVSFDFVGMGIVFG